MKIKLGHRQKEVEFRIEEVEGVDTPILEKIEGESIEDMLPEDYKDYERYLRDAFKKGKHLELEEEKYYNDLID